jgi:hypothetical protein
MFDGVVDQGYMSREDPFAAGFERHAFVGVKVEAVRVDEGFIMA